jgi:hypothetical protein
MLRCTASFPGLRRGRLPAAYVEVGLIPQALCALPLAHFTKSSQNWQFASFYESIMLVLMNSSNPGTPGSFLFF